MFRKPADYLLEDDVECWLLNAQHLKNVPGRKTDVADAAWIASWSSTAWSAPASCRLGRSVSCASPARYREALIYERTRETGAAAQGAGGRRDPSWAVWPCDVLGVSGRAMLEALVGGTTNPEILPRAGPGAAAQEASDVA